MQQILNYVDGRWVEARSQTWLDVFEPATGRVYACAPDSGPEDIDVAVVAARRAFPLWSNTPAAERSQILLRIADLIDVHRERLARAESIDTGKPITLARGLDIPRAASNFRFFATAILHAASESHAMGNTALNYTLRQPRGVAGLISPWNLPLYLFTWKIAPALATGNTAVGKPSELTPMTAHLLAELCHEAGLPAGVLNIVHGYGARVGAALTAHRDVSTISFTGGTQTGRVIAAAAAPLFKKLSLELGGKNANVVFADAPFAEAVTTSVRSSFANQGQICLCGSRILVEETLHDAFVTQLANRTRAIHIGDPLSEDAEHGALVSEAQLQKVSAYVELARGEGGQIVCGGRAPAAHALPERVRRGYYYEPTVITGLAAASRLNQEEIFGPVVTVIPFRSEAEAIEIANGTPYGLSASLWTSDLARAHRVAGALAAGTIWINTWMLRDLRVPFGGMKQSGVGREGGVDSLHFFTEAKNVCVQFAPP
ncbi:MAG: aldehyde dehydrogenase [Planctomycetota bacterium]